MIMQYVARKDRKIQWLREWACVACKDKYRLTAQRVDVSRLQGQVPFDSSASGRESLSQVASLCILSLPASQHSKLT